MNDFIGRGERLVSKLLQNPFGISHLTPQVNIRTILPSHIYESLDEEIQKHNFDFIATRRNLPNLIIEVNYKHGEKAARKARTIFKPLAEENGYDYLTIDDYECLTLFKEFGHPTYQDVIDLVFAFKTAGIKLG